MAELSSVSPHRATEVPAPVEIDPGRLRCLERLERAVLWLATWTIHHANRARPRNDALKVGGHQASSASVVSLMTALFFDVLRREDRVAVKPHASPVYHAIQHLLGRQTREQLERFRAFGGAQAYPSRTKDYDDVDFSTGSVGLGAAMTLFAAMARDYVHTHGLVKEKTGGRMVAVVGDAELDEGNVFEALLEGWKHDVRDVWWIIDYNRQSLDRVIEDRLFQRIEAVFTDLGWRVRILKYGQRLNAAFKGPGGAALRRWLDECPNSVYSALVYKGGPAWRAQLVRDLGDDSGVRALLDRHDDTMLHRLMTNLAGHDLPSILAEFQAVRDDQPTCFIAYTIKGYGLPFAGHKDNHAGLLTEEQIIGLRDAFGILPGREWDPLSGYPAGERAEVEEFLRASALWQAPPRRAESPQVALPPRLEPERIARSSTQDGFARILTVVSRQGGEVADRIVTTSPDVTVSTGLGGWVNRRGVWDRRPQADVFRSLDVASTQAWALSPKGQHVELGIAENNFFLLLAALGLTHELFGARLLPIGTLYDPFISRGLDALNYACYQDARFLLVGTPSGITLAPEGGAHQSILTPLVGIGQPGLTAFEPAYVDELAEIVRWSLEYIQTPDGTSVYLRLSTRPLLQPQRELDDALRRDIIAGGYWLEPPASDTELAIACSGAVVAEAKRAHEILREEIPGLGLLVVTSADRLHRGWRLGAQTGETAHVERLLAPLPVSAALVTVIDGSPASLSWLGAVSGHRTISLGVEAFGQSGDLSALYAAYGLDSDAIVDAAAVALGYKRSDRRLER